MDIPPGYRTVNPFVVSGDTDGLIGFVTDVFGATVRPEARTIDTDGLVLHAEVSLGDSAILFADRKPGWPATPALLQVYVDDLEATLARAVELGGEIITQPTDFYGEVFSRMLDPYGNLWWVYRPAETYEGGAWDTASDDAADSAGAEDWDAAGAEDWDAGSADWEQTPELQYIHESLMVAFPRLGGASDAR